MSFQRVFNLEPEFLADGKQFDHLFVPDELFSIGRLSAQALHVPGHTPADVAYKIGNTVFVGRHLIHARRRYRTRWTLVNTIFRPLPNRPPTNWHARIYGVFGEGFLAGDVSPFSIDPGMAAFWLSASKALPRLRTGNMPTLRSTISKNNWSRTAVWS